MATPQKIASGGKICETGPATAMETGMSERDTKKSRDEMRPSMCTGTRRWSSVPQMT